MKFISRRSVGGDEGAKKGEEYAREIALLVNEGEGIQLIIVAGMEYATLVERTGIDGIPQRDVITHVVGDNLADESCLNERRI